jgi:hypothetical protein
MFSLARLPEGLSHASGIAISGGAWAIVYLAWSLPAIRGAPLIPRRSTVLFGLLSLLSVAWLGSGFSDAIKYQGWTHALWISFADLFLIGIAAGIHARNRATPTDLTFAGFHVAMFVWIGWVAFPWMGELP